MSFIKCHWRKGPVPHGPYNCDSPIAGPIAKLTPADCSNCRVQGHYDVNYVVAQRIAPIKVREAAEGEIAPRRIHRVRVPAGSFQGSLLLHGGRLLYAYRSGWLGGRVHMADLGESLPGDRVNIDPVRTWDPGIEMPRRTSVLHVGHEDPRLFRFCGHLHVSFNGCDRLPPDGRLGSSMMLARLGDGAEPVAAAVWAPHYRLAEPIEKNWQFFEHDAQLYCVYSIEPHVVLRMDGGLANEVGHTSAGLSWPWGKLRGGAPPVRVGDEFYHFFHGQMIASERCAANGQQRVIYVMGVYTFEAKWPFAVRRFATTPVMVPPDGETSPRPELTVIFPCGAVRTGDSWLISYGHNDIDCRIAEFAAGDIESLLRPIARSPVPLGTNRVRRAVVA